MRILFLSFRFTRDLINFGIMLVVASPLLSFFFPFYLSCFSFVRPALPFQTKYLDDLFESQATSF